MPSELVSARRNGAVQCNAEAHCGIGMYTWLMRRQCWASSWKLNQRYTTAADQCSWALTVCMWCLWHNLENDRWYRSDDDCVLRKSNIAASLPVYAVVNLQGASIKNNPPGKTLYLRQKIFRQICSACRGKFRQYRASFIAIFSFIQKLHL